MRRYLFIVITIFFSGCQIGKDQSVVRLNEPVSSLYVTDQKPFYHGVASGDPQRDRVILWTRVTPDDSVSAIEVRWEIADNEQFKPVLKKEMVQTTPERDYTVKVDVDGLEPDKVYFYRFIALEKTSPVGRTKTLPDGEITKLKFAVVSCSNWQHGYFNAYDRIAEKDVDAVLHLGDYIYEYGINNARNVDRRHLPEHEIVTLSDYRTRYSQYHLDEGLRKMRQFHPIITIWDDHEVANNSYIEGAQNHQPEREGDYNARKAAARKAYYEWIPIREGEKHYRKFTFGSLAELIMLDERLEGKTKPAEGTDDPVYAREDRSMLGNEQLNWFESTLKNTSAIWKVIGNQVMFSDLNRSAVVPDNPRNMDSWDGYPAEKMRVAKAISQNNVSNIIFLTGDTHASWALEVVADPLNETSGDYKPLAVEFGTPSVSSANSNESTPDDTVIMREQSYLATNPHLKYVNQRDHGYVILTLTPEKAKAEWFYVENILKRDSSEKMARSFEVDRDVPVLK